MTFDFGALLKMAETALTTTPIHKDILASIEDQIDPAPDEIRLSGFVLSDPATFVAYALVCVNIEDATSIYLYECIAQSIQNAYIAQFQLRDETSETNIYLIKKGPDQVLQQYNIHTDTFFEL